MKYQKQFSSVLEKFKSNGECLQYFLNCLEIPELRDLRDLKCTMFSDSPLAQSSDSGIEGFVISNTDIEVYFVSPATNYIGFWGFRNFFTYRLASQHRKLNDGVLRYVINIHNKKGNNRMESFNDIREFWMYNISDCPEGLKEWTDTLYEE